MKETKWIDDDGHLAEVGVMMIADGVRGEEESYASAVAHLDTCTHCSERVADVALRSVEIDSFFRMMKPAASEVRVRSKAAPAILIGIAVAIASSIPMWIGGLEAVPEKLRMARTVFWVTLRTLVSVSRDENQMALVSVVLSTFAAVLFSAMGFYIARRASREMKTQGEA